MDHPDVVYIMAELAKEFLQPEVRWLAFGELQESDIGSEGNEAGWYHRLSAPGYLDCTDWTGPFTTEEEANSDLCDMYGDDIEMPPAPPAPPV